MSAALYAVFAAYPFVVGRRARDSRDPYLAAVLASAMAFFGARAAFVAGELDWMIGVIPVIEGAVLAVMLRRSSASRRRAARPGASRTCRRRGAGVRHGRDSAAAEAAVDHDRLGARRRRARVGVHSAFPTAGCCIRAWRCSARSSSGSRSTLRSSSTSRAARCGFSTGISTRIFSVRRRCSSRGGSCRRPTISWPARPVSSVLPGGRRRAVVPAAQHRDR